jgi:hypothetical protein
MRPRSAVVPIRPSKPILDEDTSMPKTSIIPIVCAALLGTLAISTNGAVPSATFDVRSDDRWPESITVAPPATPPDRSIDREQQDESGAKPGSSSDPGPAVMEAAGGEPGALLADLEAITDELADFTARIVYERLDSLTEEAELRYGRVVYQRPAGARHRMAILLDEYIDGTGRREKIDQRYVFADGWLVDIDGSRRQFIKRQIAPPTSDLDPLRIGQGPFPLPIGQRRADVEQRFTVHEAAIPTGRLAEDVDPATLRSVRLIPRPGTRESEEFRSIDLHYDHETLLPVLVLTDDVDGSRRTVKLFRPNRNGGLSSDDQALLSAETPDPSEWTIDVRPWRE